jgi:hypothetical protein
MCAPAPGVKASEVGAGLAAGVATSGAAVTSAAASCLDVFPGASLGSAGPAGHISGAPGLAAAAFAGLLLPLATADAGSFCCFRGDFFAAGLGSGDASDLHAEAEVTRGSTPDGKQHRCCSSEGFSNLGACVFFSANHYRQIQCQLVTDCKHRRSDRHDTLITAGDDPTELTAHLCSLQPSVTSPAQLP